MLKPGKVHIKERASTRTFTEFRHIIRGTHKGKVEITLPPTPERKVIVEQWDVECYPRPVEINPKGEEKTPELFEAKEEGE